MEIISTTDVFPPHEELDKENNDQRRRQAIGALGNVAPDSAKRYFIQANRRTTMKHSNIEVGANVAAVGNIEATAPQLRTVEVMLEDMQRIPVGADALAPAQQKQFLPTMPADQYAELKARLQAEGVGEKQAAKQAEVQAEAETFNPVTIITNIAGATDVDGLTPPDTHGAIGLNHFVEVTNSHIRIVNRSTLASNTLSLAAFFGYTTRTLFDPRAVYDSTWNRWIVTADAFAESATVQLFFIAVSTTSNAAGPYYIYALNVTFASGDFWDYPQLGMDQDSIIITANVFGSVAFKGADMFAVAKARLYNGLGFSVPVFTGLRATLAPPLVLDQNGRTFLIAASGGSALSMYTLTNSSRPNMILLTGPVNIPVPAYTAPPTAPQPGTTNRIDTLDGRFVNASTQSGNFLWQVHTINLVGYAAPKLYQINTATNSVAQSFFFFATSTSYDFNASIAANTSNDIFLTWSETDPARGTNPQVRVAFNLGSSPYVAGSGQAVFTSPTWSAGFRWGDYSAITVDPRNPRSAWLVNENAMANHDWGSRIAAVRYP